MAAERTPEPAPPFLSLDKGQLRHGAAYRTKALGPLEPGDERAEGFGLPPNEGFHDPAQDEREGASADPEIRCRLLGFAARTSIQDFEAAFRVETSGNECLSDKGEFIPELGKTVPHGWNEPIRRHFPQVFRNLQERFLGRQENPLLESQAIGRRNGQVRERWQRSLKASLLREYFSEGVQDTIQRMKLSSE